MPFPIFYEVPDYRILINNFLITSSILQMERTALTFPTIANLFLFMDSVITINISVVPKAKIVKGLFTESQINSAVTEFGAIWIKHELLSVEPEPANKRLMNKKQRDQQITPV